MNCGSWSRILRALRDIQTTVGYGMFGDEKQIVAVMTICSQSNRTSNASNVLAAIRSIDVRER